jgi:hypothetical protein
LNLTHIIKNFLLTAKFKTYYTVLLILIFYFNFIKHEINKKYMKKKNSNFLIFKIFKNFLKDYKNYAFSKEKNSANFFLFFYCSFK